MTFRNLNPGVPNSSAIHQPQPYSLRVYTLPSGFTRQQSLPPPPCATDKES